VADFFETLNDKHIKFIQAQHIFFTASAANESLINLSPKGMDSFAVINDKTVAYLDMTGSGNETAAHIHKDGRLTIMMCSFAKQPLIFRMYGQGEVINQYHNDWETWQSHFPDYPGTRQIIVLHIQKIQTSCGYAVPTAENFQHRDTLIKWSENKGEDGIKQYWQDKNRESLDGYPTQIFEDSKNA